MTNWKQHPSAPNMVLDRDGDYFLSYNPKREENPLDGLLEALSGITIPRGVPETAIVVRSTNKTFGRAHYILSGDHREAYEKLATLEECYAYFLANLDKMHPCSDKPPEMRNN